MPASLVALLGAGAGLSAAALYYNQPILGEMAAELHASPAEIGFVPMLTQLGYASGILLFAPLGDRLDRRSVIVAKSILLAVALLAMGCAPSASFAIGLSFVIGILATAAQDFVPAAAALAPVARRGKVVGSVMTGLLLGILLSRLASGTAADHFGWRSVYFGASGTIAVLAVVSALRLPRIAPTTDAAYGALLWSIVRLARESPVLQRAALAQGLISVAFSAFWSTLALALAAPPYELGSTVAGMFGIAGAAGALIAPVAGSIADRRGPVSVIRAGTLIVALSFGAMSLAPHNLPLLVLATVTFDLGTQACLISHQTIVYGLDPTARSRLNAILVSSLFFGMSIGAALASRALARWGWVGVTALGTLAGCAAFVVRALPEKRAPLQPAP